MVPPLCPAEIDHFIDYLLDEATLRPTPKMGRDALELCEAAYRSATTGHIVRLPLWSR